MEETISKKIIWKSSFDDPQGGVVEVTSDMGCFAGANQNYVSILKRTLDEEREKNIKLQNEKEALQEKLNQQIEQLKVKYVAQLHRLKDQI